MILDCLLDKASAKLDILCNKYKVQSSKTSNTKYDLKNSLKTVGNFALDGLSKKLIDLLLKWIKVKIDELIEKILSQFDTLFEEIGAKIIIIQEVFYIII